MNSPQGPATVTLKPPLLSPTIVSLMPKKRPGFCYVERLSLPNKEQTTGHDADPECVLCAINRAEALAQNPRLRNEDTNEGADIVCF